jgi:hypothetical protein
MIVDNDDYKEFFFVQEISKTLLSILLKMSETFFL